MLYICIYNHNPVSRGAYTYVTKHDIFNIFQYHCSAYVSMTLVLAAGKGQLLLTSLDHIQSLCPCFVAWQRSVIT